MAKNGPEFWPTQRAAIRLGIATRLVFIYDTFFALIIHLATTSKGLNLWWLLLQELLQAKIPFPSSNQQFKIIRAITYAHLADVLHPVTDLPGRRRLRSSSTSAVVVPSTCLRTIGDRAFPAAASRIWNSLPPEITSSRTLLTFKSSLKTYLFSLSFPVV